MTVKAWYLSLTLTENDICSSNSHQENENVKSLNKVNSHNRVVLHRRLMRYLHLRSLNNLFFFTEPSFLLPFITKCVPVPEKYHHAPALLALSQKNELTVFNLSLNVAMRAAKSNRKGK